MIYSLPPGKKFNQMERMIYTIRASKSFQRKQGHASSDATKLFRGKFISSLKEVTALS
jgi:hypothetical protein